MVRGEGAGRDFPRTFRKTPIGNWGASGSRRAGAQPRGAGPCGPQYWPSRSERESGSNRLFKLPRVCAQGEGRALRAGRDFSRFAPSPRVRGPLAGLGASGGVGRAGGGGGGT